MIVGVSFFNALGVMWAADEHPKIVFDAWATKNERSVVLAAHATKTRVTFDEFVKETKERLTNIFESQLVEVMHQNNRKTKKYGKKMGKALKDSWVTTMVLDLDAGVPTILEFEVPDEEREEYERLDLFNIR